MSHVQCHLVTGESGSGKSYLAVRHLLDEFLPERRGYYVTNLPMGEVPDGHSTPPTRPGETFVDRIAEYLVGRDAERPWWHRLLRAGLAPLTDEEIRERVHVIAEEDLRSLKRDVSPSRKEVEAGVEPGVSPVDFFADWDLTGRHIVIDEVHNYCGTHHSLIHVAEWQAFVGELRHRGASIEFITQDLEKVHKKLQAEAGLRTSISRAEHERDPIFRILLGDWYEVRAAFTGTYTAATYQQELRKDAGGKWVTNRQRVFGRNPKYFEFYNSHSKTERGGKSAAARKPHEFERRGRLGTCLWFVGRNLEQLSWRLALAVVFVWMLCGGYSVVGQGIVALFMSAMGNKQTAAVSDEAPGEVAAEEVDEVEELPQSAEELRAEVRQLRAAVASFEEDAADAETKYAVAVESAERLSGWIREQYGGEGIGGLTPTEIVFRDGRSYAVGEMIEEGAFNGTRVEEIDFSEHTVRFADGRVVRLRGVRRLPEPAATEAQGTDLFGGLQSPQGGDDVGVPRRVGVSAARDGRGPRSPDDRVGDVPDAFDGPLDRPR